FKKSVQFLFFAVICNEILRLPLEIVGVQRPPIVRITGSISYMVGAVLFGSAVWLFGKVLNGKGRYRIVFVAMLYSSAFVFLDIILAYAFLAHGDFDKQALLSALSGSPEKNVRVYNTIDYIGSFVGSIVICYVYIKLVPLVAFVHSVGAIRASLVLACAYAANVFYLWFVEGPFLIDVLKSVPN